MYDNLLAIQARAKLGSQAHKRYLKVKMPPADARSSTSEFYDWNVRFGPPEVWLVDEQGNEIEQVSGILGVSITASAGQFMTVTIDANANVEF